MSEMVERVARAICETERLHPDDAAVGWVYWKDAARAAIEAMREPTEAMLGKSEGVAREWLKADWQSLIDAALGKTP